MENRRDEQNSGEEKQDGKAEEDRKNNFAQIIKCNTCRNEDDQRDPGDRQKNDSSDDAHGNQEEGENDRIADIFDEQPVPCFNRAPNAKIGKDDIEFSVDFCERKNEDERDENRDGENSDQNRAKPKFDGDEIDDGNRQNNHNDEYCQKKEDGELEKFAKIFFSGLPTGFEISLFTLSDEIYGFYEAGFGDEGDEEQNDADDEEDDDQRQNNSPMESKKVFGGFARSAEIVIVSRIDIEATG